MNVRGMLEHISDYKEDAGLECNAHLMEESGDYRVLRRFRPFMLKKLLDERPLPIKMAVVDVETTGLDSAVDEVIEIGICTGEMLCYSALQEPSGPLPEVITDITGITDGDLKGRAIDWDEISHVLGAVDVVVAHNAGFDRKFIERYCKSAKLVPWLCSISDINHGHLKTHLENLAMRAGVFYGAHRAAEDAMVTMYSLMKLGLMDELTSKIEKPHYRAMAHGAPFNRKDKLKNAGYRWHQGNLSTAKCWHKLISSSDVDEERKFLSNITSCGVVSEVSPLDIYSCRDL